MSITQELAEAVEQWLRDRGWNTLSLYEEAVSVRGPWQHPHRDGRPMFWWSTFKPMEVFDAMAPVVGLPASRLRADFLRHRSALSDA